MSKKRIKKMANEITAMHEDIHELQALVTVLLVMMSGPAPEQPPSEQGTWAETELPRVGDVGQFTSENEALRRLLGES